MIATGTLCILLAPHGLAGASCTVLGTVPLAATITISDEGQAFRMGCDWELYDISVDGHPPSFRHEWCAFRDELFPIAPPSIQADVAQSKHAKRLRKMGAPA